MKLFHCFIVSPFFTRGGLTVGRQSRQKRERKAAPVRGQSDHAAQFRLAMHDVLAEDKHALDSVCRKVAVMEVDGEQVTWIEPLRKYDDCMEFDRAVCAAGLKRYARRGMPSDVPDRPDLKIPEMLIVEEIKPGIRGKCQVSGFVPFVRSMQV